MMIDIREHEAVRRYLDDVCRPIRAREVHADVRLELTGHLEELAEAYLERRGGDSEVDSGDGELPDAAALQDEAVLEAIRQMGDPRLVGKQLHRIHRPKTDWTLVALAAALIGIGLLAMVGLQSALPGNVSVHFNYLASKLAFSAAGAAALLLFYFFDYRRLRRWSIPLYAFAVLLMLLPHTDIGDIRVQGTVKWIELAGVSIDTTSVAPYLFMIAYAGMLVSDKGTSVTGKMKRYAEEFGFFFVVPGYLYLLAPSLVALLVHFAGATVLLFSMRGGWKRWSLFVASGTAFLFVCYVMTDRFRFYNDRLHYYWQSFIGNDSLNDPGHFSVEAIRSAGLWGHGFGQVLNRLPYPYGENIVAFLFYSFGWIGGSLLTMLVASFILRLTVIASRTREPYARRVVLGLSAILAVKLVWSLLMAFSLLPFVGIPLPIVGYNGFDTVLEIASLGFILGVYRRKDIVGHTRSESMAF